MTKMNNHMNRTTSMVILSSLWSSKTMSSYCHLKWEELQCCSAVLLEIFDFEHFYCVFLISDSQPMKSFDFLGPISCRPPPGGGAAWFSADLAKIAGHPKVSSTKISSKVRFLLIRFSKMAKNRPKQAILKASPAPRPADFPTRPETPKTAPGAGNRPIWSHWMWTNQRQIWWRHLLLFWFKILMKILCKTI